MRIKNIKRNSFFSLLSQLLLIVLGFLSNRILNIRLGEALIGVNGVASNVVGVLSVTELGFSTAVVYHLYRVLDEHDTHAIAGLMNLYRRAYQIIAAVIGSLGLCLLPYIHLFMKENPYSLTYVRVIFLLWLARSVLSYVLGYRRSILIADQQEYIVSILTLLTNLVNYLTVIGIVLLTDDYIAALACNVLFEALMNILLNAYVKRRYPYLSEYRTEKIRSDDRRKVFDDMKNIFFSKLYIKIFTSTDNLIISGFIGVVINGLYNNYCLISGAVVNLIVALGNSIQPTIANLFLEKDTKKNVEAYRQFGFLFFLIAAFVTASLMSLMTPFVKVLWLDERYALDFRTVAFLAANVGVQILGIPLSSVMGVSGLFRQERNLAILVSIENVVVSIVLVKPLGVVGVILGTMLANILCILVRLVLFFKVYLKQAVKSAALEICGYALLVALETALTVFLTDRIGAANGIAPFFVCCVLCVLIPNGINLLLFGRSRRMQSLVNMVFHKTA